MENDVEIKAIIERTKTQLGDFYNGANWVTENFATRILSLRQEEAIKKIPGHSHSVAELTAHIIAWKNFVVQKLTGNDGFDITDEPADWPNPGAWELMSNHYETVHQNLLAAIENFPAENWNAKVPGRNYTFIFLVTGIIQHDYYHYGQIGSLLAGIKKI